MDVHFLSAKKSLTMDFAIGKVWPMDIRHPLAVWIEGHPEISQSKMAADSDCSEGHLSLILQRKRGVSMKLAQRLSVATGGQVKIEDFLLDEHEAAQ